jgi:two-component system chemotaxis sensor kinase CheA
MDDLLSEFLTETNEAIDNLDVEIVRLEQDPNDPDLLSGIFRLVHTIKGTCGFLGLPRLESVAHAGENILVKFRDGELSVTPEAVTLILESLDAIKSLLAALAKTETEPEGDDSDLIARLNTMANRETGAVSAPVVPESASEPEPLPAVAEIDLEVAPATWCVIPVITVSKVRQSAKRPVKPNTGLFSSTPITRAVISSSRSPMTVAVSILRK